ncbi:MAG: ATP-dependent helicase [Mangrovibacterium sp.]
MKYLEGLNAAQRQAVENIQGPSLVIAGAGSGKTRVLTYRIAHLINKGVSPSSILSLTFTNKASREMRERISTIVGDSVARYLWMGTFHSIFSRILRVESDRIGFSSNFTIYDSAESKSLIKTILKSMDLSDKVYKPNVVASRISAAKNNLITCDVYAKQTDQTEYDASIRMPRIAQIYKEYTKRCRLASAMDFDDLLLNTNILFRDFPDVLEKYQKRFSYILVDEYQDTNFAQYLIVRKLASKHQNLCVVGDDAQSIYSFRGAKIENILNFQKDYPKHQVFKLEQNYRSTQTIVNAANSVIQKNARQLKKDVFSENAFGDKIKVFANLTDRQEGDVVVDEIARTRMEKNYRLEDYAILYRTNAQSRVFEESLMKRGIAYKVYGGLSFYQRKEIKDLLAYFRLLINPKDNEALKRIINYPLRGIGATTLEKLEKYAELQLKSIFDVICQSESTNPIGFNKGTLQKLISFKNLMQSFASRLEELDAYQMAHLVSVETGLLKEMHGDQTPEGITRYENMQGLLNGIQEFAQNAKEEGLPQSLADYMADVALLTDQDSEKEEDREKVTLMTVHSSKGLEFKNVFVVGLEQNLFPSAPRGGQVSAMDFEEERRLFYVALTRAEENAYLSYAKQRYKHGNLEFANPSQFIAEVDPKYLDMPEEEDMTFFERDAYSPSSSLSSRSGYRSQSAVLNGRIGMNPQSMNQKLMQMREAKRAVQSEAGDDPRKIEVGMEVEHQRFGRGVVEGIEGLFPDLKVTITFKSVGTKHLLTKFAKLRIVKEEE